MPTTTTTARIPPYSIDVSERAGVRYLHFGSPWIQGAMRIARPQQLELAYTREILLALLLRGFAHWPRSALFIGLGTASLPRFVHHYLPHCVTDIVEIDPRIPACARQFFHLPEESERFRIHLADGAQWIAECQQTFDFIVIDGFDDDANPGELDAPAFYAALLPHLSSEGLLAINLLGSPRTKEQSMARLRHVFGERVRAFASADAGNAVVLAAAGEAIDLPIPDLHERAQQLKQQTTLDLAPSLARLLRNDTHPGDRFRL